MSGAVTASGVEAVLQVTVMTPSRNQETRVDAIVDTGFTGFLTLPQAVADSLSLPLLGSAPVILADGSTTVEDVCFARILWHEEPRPV